MLYNYNVSYTRYINVINLLKNINDNNNVDYFFSLLFYFFPF